eukprot:8695201-Alexandrium_andersonii.AAC.1
MAMLPGAPPHTVARRRVSSSRAPCSRGSSCTTCTPCSTILPSPGRDSSGLRPRSPIACASPVVGP